MVRVTNAHQDKAILSGGSVSSEPVIILKSGYAWGQLH
jgi:hypothetical protein